MAWAVLCYCGGDSATCSGVMGGDLYKQVGNLFCEYTTHTGELWHARYQLVKLTILAIFYLWGPFCTSG